MVGDGAVAAWAGRLQALVAGPRLQVVNLAVLYAVVVARVDYPHEHDFWMVVASVALAALLDAAATRLHWGSWRFPWGTVVATMGIWLLLDSPHWQAFALLPAILVGSKHLIRTAHGHLFNANNLAAAILIVAGWARVGVNDWGGARETVALMVLFGTVATIRAKRFGLAVTYLAFSLAVYAGVALWRGEPLAAVRETAFVWALAPVNVMMGFFAVTDPATSPSDYRSQAVWALLIVLVGVPAALAGRPDFPVFALLVMAPQRHVVAAWFAARRGARAGAPQPVAGAAP